LEIPTGRIYLWDHEIEYHGRRARIDELVLLASDVDDLLSHLEGDDSPQVDDKISDLGRLGDIGGLDSFIESGGNINALSTGGEGIVACAAYKGHLAFIKECVRRGASLNGALHAAVFAGNSDVIEFLLENGADPNERDKHGRLPLDGLPEMIYERKPPFVKLMEERGGRRSPR
jgi:hypothetical protein